MKLATVLATLSLFSIGCEVDRTESAPQVDEIPFYTGHGPTRGHEDITRFGIAEVNKWLASATWIPAEKLQHFQLPAVSKGDSGPSSSNAVVKGNYHTDYPNTEMYNFYGRVASADWHGEPDLQTLHGLRNYVGKNTSEYASSACQGIRDRIREATRYSMSLWKNADYASANFWAGHALHIIQDSYSRAHTHRSNNYATLDNICVYERNVIGACKHATVSEDDRIWRGSFSCSLNPWDRKFGCLKRSAQAASHASAGYLYALSWAKYGIAVDTIVGYFLDGHSGIPYSGQFRCDNLE